MTPLDTFSPSHSKYTWEIFDVGLIHYGKALDLQVSSWEEVKNGGNHKILLLEHPDVITLGKRTEEEHLLLSKEELQDANIELFRVDRGGSATYHGPGQLVGYVICKSSRVGGIHELVARILTSISKVMEDFGIPCNIDKENPGIWTQSEIPRKLAAVGLSNKEGYTKHGFAINIDLPLTGFTAIVPCGLTLPVSTMSIEKGMNISIEDVKKVVIKHLKDQLSLDPHHKILAD